MTPEEYEQLKAQLPQVPGASSDPTNATPSADPSTLVSAPPALTSQMPAPVPVAIPSTSGIETPGQANGAALGQILGGNPRAGLATAQSGQELKGLPLEPKPITPIGPKPGGLLGGGASGLPTGPLIDPGVVAPRPSGPSKSMQSAMMADQKKIDAARDATEASQGETQDALRAVGQTASDTSLGKQAVTQQAIDKSESIQSQQDAFRSQVMARQDALDAERKAQLAELDATKIDPSKYWNDKSTGQKVLTGIGVALGALGAGLAKTQNFAGQMFESAINRDVESQRANIEKQTKIDSIKAEMAKEGLTQAQWVDQQLNQKRQMGYEVLQKQIGNYAAMSDSAETQAKAQQAIGQVEQLKQGTRANDAAAHLAALQKQALAASAPSAEQLALQKAGAKELDEIAAKRAANGEAPLTSHERLSVLRGYGAAQGGGALPGTVGGFVPGVNKADAKNKADARTEAEANAGATVDAQAKGLSSTSVFEHPVDRATSALGLPGTAGSDANRAGQVWNAGVIADFHRLAGVRDPEKAKELAEGMLYKPGMSAATIDKVVAARKKFAQSFSASPGVGTGGIALPAGAKAED